MGGVMTKDVRAHGLKLGPLLLALEEAGAVRRRRRRSKALFHVDGQADHLAAGEADAVGGAGGLAAEGGERLGLGALRGRRSDVGEEDGASGYAGIIDEERGGGGGGGGGGMLRCREASSKRIRPGEEDSSLLQAPAPDDAVAPRHEDRASVRRPRQPRDVAERVSEDRRASQPSCHHHLAAGRETDQGQGPAGPQDVCGCSCLHVPHAADAVASYRRQEQRVGAELNVLHVGPVPALPQLRIRLDPVQVPHTD
eukprot:746102-Hanusia_phi.AAC.2